MFQFISNQKCTGVDGKDVCCLGYLWNEKTEKCEKCPLGFFGKDCAAKCSYPFYGEDCQSTCMCSKNDCHVSRGCFTNFETFINRKLGSPRIYTAKHSTITPFISISNKDFSNPTASQDFSTDIHKHLSNERVDTNNSSSDDWLKNSVALSLFGIFVLFFSIFVIAYIYSKCFRKDLNAKSNISSEWQVKYQSLSLDTRQPLGAAYEEPEEQLIVRDSTYLSPVFSRGSEISSVDSNDVSREITAGEHSLSHVPTYIESETNSSLEFKQRTYVYTEIAENGTREITGGEHSLSHVPTHNESKTKSSLEIEQRTYHVYTEITENGTREITGGEHSLSHVPTHNESKTKSSLEIEQRTYHVYTEITENGTREITGGEHSLSHVPTYIESETNSSLELQQRTYVYTEIAESGAESSIVSVGNGCKPHVSSNAESSAAMDKDVLQMNVESQQV